MFVLNWKDHFETQNQFFICAGNEIVVWQKIIVFDLAFLRKRYLRYLISEIKSLLKEIGLYLFETSVTLWPEKLEKLINDITCPTVKIWKKISGQKKASGKIFETLQFEITLSKNFENVVKIIIRYLSLDGCHSECHPLNLHSLYVYSWKTSQHNHTRSNRPSKLTFSYFRQNYNAWSEMCRALWTEGSQDQYWRCGCG